MLDRLFHQGLYALCMNVAIVPSLGQAAGTIAYPSARSPSADRISGAYTEFCESRNLEIGNARKRLVRLCDVALLWCVCVPFSFLFFFLLISPFANMQSLSVF